MREAPLTRIGVLSDTHLRQHEPLLAAKLAGPFAGVDLILHAGDLVTTAVLEGLEAPQVLGVCGNMDDHVVAASLPVKRIVEVEGIRIGLIHGWGPPVGLAARVAKEFQAVDCIVFGHSHRPMNARKDGVLFFNPGSVSRGVLGSGTVGLLTVDGGISGRIIKL